MKKKDSFCSYYTQSDEILEYMVSYLDVRPEDLILEPAAGNGCFIHKILEKEKDAHILALDLNEEAIFSLKSEFSHYKNVRSIQTDTLLEDNIEIYASQLKENGKFNKIIANPPYGAWQSHEKRELLKKKYNGFYAKETYSLFLLRCISLLEVGGKLAFIIPDTYLFLNRHKQLRKYLLENTRIDTILIFPSKLFPGVAFGYSNLSIITLEKTLPGQKIEEKIQVIKGIEDTKDFIKLLNLKENRKNYQVFECDVQEILSTPEKSFILNEKAQTILKLDLPTLGDQAEVVTGLYTGNNSSFIRVRSKEIKGSKNYDVVNPKLVFECNSLEGLNVEEAYIPYIKGSPESEYDDSINWFIRWDQKTVDFYKTDKKARFQNASFYFQKGIGLPMVKSKKVKAFLINEQVFDQSIVGIFPKDPSKYYYFLALLNSDVVNDLIHQINPTANNSANYIKRIPYLEPNQKTLELINEQISELLASHDEKRRKELKLALNKELEEIYSNPLLYLKESKSPILKNKSIYQETLNLVC